MISSSRKVPTYGEEMTTEPYYFHRFSGSESFFFEDFCDISSENAYNINKKSIVKDFLQQCFAHRI